MLLIIVCVLMDFKTVNIKTSFSSPRSLLEISFFLRNQFTSKLV